tara:strand:- start:795 stop:959 length:165 start_codon:yes stop_codon:yes gene_type:complete
VEATMDLTQDAIEEFRVAAMAREDDGNEGDPVAARMWDLIEELTKLHPTEEPTR